MQPLQLSRLTAAGSARRRGGSHGIATMMMVKVAAAPQVTVPGKLSIGLDWFYLPVYPLLESLPGIVTWGAAATLTIIMVAMP